MAYKFLSLPPDFCPKYATFDEACSFSRHGRWIGHKKVREGRWRTFKDGGRRVVIFASVVEDMQRREAEDCGKPIEPAVKRKPGRPRKPRPEDQTSQAG